MKKKIAVIIPYYHNQLTELEKVSYSQCLKILKRYKIILLVPDNMNRNDYPKSNIITIEKVPEAWMKSVNTYNRMMLNPEFYRRFQQFDYILIYQLDAFVFFDQLEEFCNYGYDYIGAPWIYGKKYFELSLSQSVWYVGNGGLSLRKVSSFLKCLNAINTSTVDCAEDIFWARQNSDYFKVAPIEIAIQFSFETNVRMCFLLNEGKLPFGCHAWEKHDFEFWYPFFQKEGYLIEKKKWGNHDSYENDEFSLHLEMRPQIVLRNCNCYFNWDNKQIFLWGSGRIGKECGWLLNRMGIDDFTYVDSDKTKWWDMMWERTIYPPDKLKNISKKKTVVIITVKNEPETILQILLQYGYKYMKNVFIFKEWKKQFENLYGTIKSQALY